MFFQRLFSACALFCFCAASSSAGTLPTQTWPMYQYTADHNAVFEAPDWNVAWTADIAQKNNGGLSIVGRTVYVESFDHAVYAFDALTGARRWRAPVDDIAMATSLVDRNVVVAGTGTGQVIFDDGSTFITGRSEGNAIYAFDASTGALKWRYATRGQNMPAGILLRGANATTFLFSNGDEHLRALDLISGALLWEKPSPGNATMSSLASDGENIFGISFRSARRIWEALERGDTAAVDELGGTWSIGTGGNLAWQAHYGAADCSPTLGGAMVFVENVRFSKIAWLHGAPAWPGGPTAYPDFSKSTLYSEVQALDRRTGKLVWQYRSNAGLSSFAGSNIAAVAGLYSNGTFYEALPFSHEFAAFNAATGALQWKTPTQGAVKMGAVVKDGRVYFGDNSGMFYVLDASSGKVLHQQTFAEPFGFSPPVIVGRTLFITNGRTLHAVPLSRLTQ